MVASNVAVLLATRSSRPVVLIDGDLQFGDIAVMLKLAPQLTVVDAVQSIDGLDIKLLRAMLTRHLTSGLLVLAAPFEPAFADQIGPGQMHRIIALLRTLCDYVLIDTPAAFNDVVFGLVEDSDDVVLVAGPDIPNLKNAKIGLQTLRLLNTPVSRILLAVNRADPKVRIDVNEVERTLELSAACVIPNDVLVSQSVNQGRPVVLESPKAGASRAIERLADLLAPAVGGAAGRV